VSEKTFMSESPKRHIIADPFPETIGVTARSRLATLEAAEVAS